MVNNYPPPIYGKEPSSWAQSTILVRLPEIATRMIQENTFSPQVIERVSSLIEGIPDQSLRKLTDRHAPDSAKWDAYLAPQTGKKWLEVPWFFAEHYFYRRIMEAVDYFVQSQDPFLYQKRQGLIQSREDTEQYTAVIAKRLERGKKHTDLLREVLLFSLWGNQADLSLWPAGSSQTPKHSSQNTLQDHLLADDSARILKTLHHRDPETNRVDIMLDNAGFELICDLGLTDTLLTHHLAESVVLHVKAHPTFVSDVIQEDIELTVDFLQRSGVKDSADLATRLKKHIQEDRIIITPHFFWNSPLPMWEIPPDLLEDLSQSQLLISKGDANYRRLLGDRQWDFTLPFQEVVDYLPVPVAALRSFKAELAVGLTLDQIQETFNKDPNWLTDGKWAVMQFSPGSLSTANTGCT
jgi:hypothetical protein